MKEKISKESHSKGSILKHQECFETDGKSQGKTKDIQTNITHPVWRGTWQDKWAQSSWKSQNKKQTNFEETEKKSLKKTHEEYLPLKPPPPTGRGRDNDLKIHTFAIVLSVADIKESSGWNHRWA